MQFNFSIGGYFASNFELLLKKGNLVCVISDSPFKCEEPTHIFSIENDPDWEALLQLLQTLKWKEYYDSNICDGIQWDLKFRHKDIKLRSSGSNAYPNDFKKFLKLLNKITAKYGISKIN